MRIEKKVWAEYFNDILSGIKNFELRLNDSEYNIGDILVLKEWNPETKKFTGRLIEKKITYILKTKDLNFWSKDEIEKYGYLVFGLQ
jgi:hypothetical protein